MAGTDEITQNAEKMGALTNYINSLSGSGNSVSAVLNSFKGAGSDVSSALKELTSHTEGFGSSLKDTTKFTEQQSAALSTITAGIFGAGTSFKEGATNVGSFGAQITGIGSQIGKVTQLASKLGIKIDLSGVNEAMSAFKQLGENVIEAADAHLKSQNIMIETAAAAGELSDLYSKAGTNLQNMNEVVGKSNLRLVDTMRAVGVANDQDAAKVEAYYMQLGQIPGALKENIGAASGAAGKTDELTAAMQLARGAGRDAKDVIEDLSKAHLSLGLSGEIALKFTARMGEMSNKFGVELGAVRGALTSTAEGLKMVGTENQAVSTIMEGATRIVNNYMQALKDTGVSGATALGVIRDMTEHVSKLTMAQKAFVSSQTGGPGGLRGAFDIELKMKEGKVDEVFEDVRKTMMKQFGGRIVSVEEATKDEGAAQQLTRQRMMLQQGPLGAFAKDDQSAGRILEMFSEVSSGKRTSTGLGESIVQDTMKQGVDQQALSNTHLSKIYMDLRAWKTESQTAAAGIIQALTTERAGTTRFLNLRSEDQEESRFSLRQSRGVASRRAGESAATGFALTSAEQPGIAQKRIAIELTESIKELPTAVKGAFEIITGFIKEGKTGDAKQKVIEIQNRIDAEKEAAKREPDKSTQHDMQQRIIQEERALNSVKAGIGAKETQTHREAFQEAKRQSEAEKLPSPVKPITFPKPKVTSESPAIAAPVAPVVATRTAVTTPVATGTTTPDTVTTTTAPSIPATTTATPNEFYRGIVDRFESIKQSAPKEMQSHVAKLEEAASKQDQEKIRIEEKNIQNLITRQEKTVASSSGTKQTDAMKTLSQYTTVQNKLFGTEQDKSGGLVQLASKPPEPTSKQTTASAISSDINRSLDQYMFPGVTEPKSTDEGKSVATALQVPSTDRRASPTVAIENVAATNAATQSTAAAAKAEPTTVAAAGKTAPEALQVHVNIDGICPHCRNLINGDQQGAATMGPTNLSPVRVA